MPGGLWEMTATGVEQPSPRASRVHTFCGAIHALEFLGDLVEARVLPKPYLARCLPLPWSVSLIFLRIEALINLLRLKQEFPPQTLLLGS